MIAAVRARFEQALVRLPWATRGYRFVRRLAGASDEDRVTGLAAEAAFFAILGIFPAFLALAAVLGSIADLLRSDVAARVEGEVVNLLRMFLSDRARGMVSSVESLFSQGRGGLFTFAALGSLWAASRGMAGVLRALDAIYDEEGARSRLHTRLLAIGLALGSVVAVAVVLTALVLGPLLGSGTAVARIIGVEGAYTAAWRVLRLPVSFAVALVWALVVLHVGHTVRHRWREDVPGAVTTAVLWVVVSVGFRGYLAVAGGSNPVFGVLGGGLVLLTWLYLMSLALLLGGEVNSVLAGSGAQAGSPGTATAGAPPDAGLVRRGGLATSADGRARR